MFLQYPWISAEESEGDDRSSGEEYVPCSASENDGESGNPVSSPLDASIEFEKDTRWNHAWVYFYGLHRIS